MCGRTAQRRETRDVTYVEKVNRRVNYKREECFNIIIYY